MDAELDPRWNALHKTVQSGTAGGGQKSNQLLPEAAGRETRPLYARERKEEVEARVGFEPRTPIDDAQVADSSRRQNRWKVQRRHIEVHAGDIHSRFSD